MADFYDLTIAQRTIMNTVGFALNKSKMSESNIFLNFYFKVKRSCDFIALEKTYQFIMKNNDSLRLYFFKKGFRMVQKILPWNDQKPEKIILDNDESFEAFYQNLNQYKIPVVNHSPIRSFLVKVGDSGAIIFRVHHLLIDGFGTELLLEQMKTFYLNAINGKETPIDSVSIQKYFEKEEKYCRERIKKDRKYWTKVHFRQKHYHSVVPFCGGQSSLTTRYIIDKERHLKLMTCLQELSQEKMVSIQSMVSYLIGLTIYRITGRGNFAISHLSHGRRHYALKKCIGNMAELIPAYFDIQKENTIKSNFYLYNDEYYKNMKNGHLPLIEHLCLITPMAIKDRFNYQHFWWLQFSSMKDLDELETENIEVDVQESNYMRFPFYIGMYETPNVSIYFDLEHQEKRFPREKTDYYWSIFIDTLDLFVDNQEEKIGFVF